MKLLLVAVPVLVIAAACGGGDGDGLERIERLDFENVELQPSDPFEPSIPNPYPDVVATVNGEEITGEALVFQQMWSEFIRQRTTEFDATLQSPWLAGIEPTDPLEAVIEEELLDQAVARLGLLPTYQDAVEYTRKQEEAALIVEMSSDPGGLRGFSSEDWASDAEVVEKYRRGMGVAALRSLECVDPSAPVQTIDCSAFLAAERENAVIEYFVVWAE